jgi:stage II sporulation protein D
MEGDIAVNNTRASSKWVLVQILVLLILLTGFAALPVQAQIPAKVRVGIITSNTGSQYRNASVITFTVKGGYKVIDLSAIPGMDIMGTPLEDEQWQVFFLAGGMMQVYQNGKPIKTTAGPVVVREIQHGSGNKVCLVNYTVSGTTAVSEVGRRYRGNMEFRSSGTTLMAINELPMEEYLYGVVPREMSDKWPLEALKAQAIGARTYAAANFSKHVVEGFNMLDTPYDQAYGGINCEGANATKAVQDTAGKSIVFNGKPISAVYHSNSGGHTEDNENVWGTTPVEYLRGKEDPYSQISNLSNWTFKTTIDEVRNKLTQAGSVITGISSVKLEKYSSGRVKKVFITDTNGNTITKTGSEFGKLFNPKFYTSINNTSFMSNYFDVKMDQLTSPTYSVINNTGEVEAVTGIGLYGVSDDGNIGGLNSTNPNFYILSDSGTSSVNKAATGQVIFEGHGWGHGVGMSQWGAYEMAKQGKTYNDILKFYYTGVEIKNETTGI